MKLLGLTATVQVILALLIASSVSFVNAETSWPAGALGSEATYRNQGHRLVKNGNYLHFVYDFMDPTGSPTPRNCCYYTNSSNLGTNWASIESVRMGGYYEVERYGTVAADGNDKPWITAVGIKPNCDEHVLCGTVRRARSDWNKGCLWDGNANPGYDIVILSVSSVLSPSGGQEPMVYSLVAYQEWDAQPQIANVKLYFFAWDTATGSPTVRRSCLVTSVSSPASDELLLGSIAASGHSGYDTIHIAYQKKDGSTSKIYYVRSTNSINPSTIRSGTTPSWSSSAVLTTPSGPTSEPGTDPCIEFDDGCDSVLVAWRGPGSSADVFRRARKLQYSWSTSPVNMSQTTGVNSEFPTLSTRYGVSWQEYVSSTNYDIDAWLDAHVVTVKATGNDSTSKYPHIAVVPPSDPYYVDCYTCWTEKCGSSGAGAYKTWFKKYHYIPAMNGGGGGAKWVRLEENEALLEIRPNPSFGKTSIACTVPLAGHYRIEVLGEDGRLIRSLDYEQPVPGTHRIAWDGRDHKGHAVPQGAYMFVLSGCNIHAVSAVAVIR